MKKIILLIIGLLLIGCAMPQKIERTICTNTIEEPIKIERSITLMHKKNLIQSVESVEKMYFSETFTKEMFNKLIEEMKERHIDSKNLSFEEEVGLEYATVTIKLNSLDNATAPELKLIGIEEDDPEFVPGIIETVRLNEKAGYTCKVIED